MGHARDYTPAVKFGHKWYPEDLVLGQGIFGDYYYVDYLNGSDDNVGTSVESAFKTLGQAHTAVTSNHGDVVYLNGTTGEHLKESAMLDWSKNRISVVGIGPSGVADPQPEIQLSAAGNAADNAATLKVSGYGNSFTNLYISNAGTHASSLSALWDAGENNTYNNCQFAKFSDLDETGVANVIGRGDTTTWRNCKFGVTWVTVEVARAGLWAKGIGGAGRMQSNYFENCKWVVSSDDADYDHFRVYDNNSLAFENVFVNPVFYSTLIASVGAVITTTAVESSAALADGSILLINPACNTTNLCTVNDQVKVVGPSMSLDGGAAAVGTTLGIGQTPE